MTSTFYTAPRVSDAFGAHGYSQVEITTQEGDVTWKLFGKARLVEVQADMPEPDYGSICDMVIFPGPNKVSLVMELVPDASGVVYTLSRKENGISKHFPIKGSL